MFKECSTRSIYANLEKYYTNNIPSERTPRCFVAQTLLKCCSFHGGSLKNLLLLEDSRHFEESEQHSQDVRYPNRMNTEHFLSAERTPRCAIIRGKKMKKGKQLMFRWGFNSNMFS